MRNIIAIDGPAGSGKGTVAKLIALKKNLVYIDTGAMYRAIAYLALKNNIDIHEEDKIINIASNANIGFKQDKVFVNNEDVTEKIRSMEVTSIVSQISSIVSLREIMVNLQRKFALNYDVIMEGRDITTVVFPNAQYKFYLDADLEERARRRYKENREKGIKSTYEEIITNIKTRDYNDAHKKVGSLKRCDDQIYIDTTNLSIDEVVNIMLEAIKF